VDTAAVKGVFRKHFGFSPAHAVWVPGRLDLLGGETAAHEGLVLTAAINRFLFLAFSPRTDGRIELISSAIPEAHKFWISRLVHSPTAPWTDYVKGMLVQLRKRGVHFNGFNAAIHSTIPPGLGMGSSAALTIAAALAVRQLSPYSLTELGAGLPPARDRRGRLPPIPAREKHFLAGLCQAAEAEFVGSNCELPEPLAPLFGRAHHLLNIDCRFQTLTHTPLIGETLVVCDTGVRRETNVSEPAESRDHCHLALRALRAKSLRSVEVAYLKRRRADLNHREYACAYHVVGEIQRVVFAERALREDDHGQFGQYLFQSHESARDAFRIGSPEVELLMKLARAHPGCVGARSVDGSGEATVNAVAYHQVEDFIRTITRQYEKRTGSRINPMVCQMVGGME
jgi:galactokinase